MNDWCVESLSAVVLQERWKRRLLCRNQQVLLSQQQNNRNEGGDADAALPQINNLTASDSQSD